MTDDNNIITIGNLNYIKECPECITCEFIPVCILCTWISKSEIDDILNSDIGIMDNRAYHVREKKRKVKKLYKKYGMVKSKRKMDINEENVIIL